MNRCFNCNEKGTLFHGFMICNTCKKKLNLFTSNTIKRHIEKQGKSNYQKDVSDKLALLENVYIKKKIKLLDLLSKLEN